MSILTFSRKPMPLMAEHRPIYKMTQMLLVLHLASRGNKSSLIRLHLFSWILKDEKRKQDLLASVKNQKIPFGVWGIDPAINISIQFSGAEGLVKRAGLTYRLTQRGLEYVSKIDDELAFKEDYSFLKLLGPQITEGMVKSIVGEWE